MTPGTFEHRGITITFDAKRAMFTATVNGKAAEAASLDAMKKKIEKENAVAFTTFKAFVIDSGGYGDNERFTIRSFTVTGVAKERGKYGAAIWLIEGGGPRTSERRVTEDTPKNRAAAQALVDYRNETVRIDAAREKQKEKLAEAVKSIAPPR